MFAIVRSGSRQQKVAVGDVIEIDLIEGEVGDSIELEPLMIVDGDKSVTDKDKLGKVSAEIVGATKGPKIRIFKYKNKTGYSKRQGHRQRYTQVKITGIK